MLKDRLISFKHVFAFILALSVLTSCATDASPAPSKTMDEVIAEGGLADMDELQSGATDYETAEVVLGSVNRIVDTNVRVITPVTRELFFERDNGRLKAVHVIQGDRVKKDDVLAEIVFDTDRLEAERERITLESAMFERNARLEDAKFMENMEKARQASDEASENDFELLALQLMNLELEYEKFLFNNGSTREQYAKDLEDINEQLNGEQIAAPFDGIISFVFSSKEGDLVRNSNNAVTIIDDSKIQFSITGQRDVIRYGDTFQVTNKDGTIEFTAKVVSDPVADFSTEVNLDFALEPTDPNVIPSILDSGVDVEALGRTILTAAPMSMSAEEALLIPRGAMNPENDRNFVYILEDGILKKRYVTVGLVFPDVVQIIDGLTAGQSVVLSQ